MVFCKKFFYCDLIYLVLDLLVVRLLKRWLLAVFLVFWIVEEIDSVVYCVDLCGVCCITKGEGSPQLFAGGLDGFGGPCPS